MEGACKRGSLQGPPCALSRKLKTAGTPATHLSRCPVSPLKQPATPQDPQLPDVRLVPAAAGGRPRFHPLTRRGALTPQSSVLCHASWCPRLGQERVPGGCPAPSTPQALEHFYDQVLNPGEMGFVTGTLTPPKIQRLRWVLPETVLIYKHPGILGHPETDGQ